MAPRRVNPNRIKIHHTYSVEETADLLGVHKQTVRNWQKTGLTSIDDQRPTLFKGTELKAFLQERRQQAKQTCAADEMYCCKCRTPRKPAGDAVDYIPVNETSGNLRGICEVCETFMHRRTSITRLDELETIFELAYPQGRPRLSE